jgi:FixJ family two-component response regulator
MCDANSSDEKLVLVVDDDSSARESMAEIQDAKTPHFPCLVLLDLATPVMDGRGFLELR